MKINIDVYDDNDKLIGVFDGELPKVEEVKEEKTLGKKLVEALGKRNLDEVATQHFEPIIQQAREDERRLIKEKFDRESNSWTCKLVSSEVIRKALFGEE